MRGDWEGGLIVIQHHRPAEGNQSRSLELVPHPNPARAQGSLCQHPPPHSPQF